MLIVEIREYVNTYRMLNKLKERVLELETMLGKYKQKLVEVEIELAHMKKPAASGFKDIFGDIFK
jgi:hypothetical protein